MEETVEMGETQDMREEDADPELLRRDVEAEIREEDMGGSKGEEWV